jgi:hypothetical protein
MIVNDDRSAMAEDWFTDEYDNMKGGFPMIATTEGFNAAGKAFCRIPRPMLGLA